MENYKVKVNNEAESKEARYKTGSRDDSISIAGPSILKK